MIPHRHFAQKLTALIILTRYIKNFRTILLKTLAEKIIATGYDMVYIVEEQDA